MFKKILFLTLAALPLAINAQPVKLSGLPTVSSIGGSEQILLLQSGADKTATVGQVTAAALAATATVAANLATETTLLAPSTPTGIKSSNFVNNVQCASSNFVNNVQCASSNFISNVQLASSNHLSGAQVASSNFLSNVQIASSNFQNSAQVSAAITAAAAGGAQIGGTATFAAVGTLTAIVTNLITPTYSLADVTVSSPTVVALDCTKGNYFTVNLTAPSLNNCFITIANCQDGQQITVVIHVKAGSATFQLLTNNSQSGFTLHGTPLNSSTTSGDTWFLNWVVVKTDVVFSGGKI